MKGIFMEITDVRIRLLKTENRLKAYATITIDDAFAVHELRILEGSEGLFVVMPSRMDHKGVYRDIAHPVTAESRLIVEEKVLAAYQEALANEE